MKGCFRPLSITDRHSLSQYDLSDVKIAMISLEILERGPVLCPVAEPQSNNSMCKLPETWASGRASLGLRSQVEKAGAFARFQTCGILCLARDTKKFSKQL